MKARLHPKWVGGRDGYCYSVLFDGKLLVDRSRDPECDAARALLAKGITGKLTLCDGKTGVPAPSSTSRRPPSSTVEESGMDLRFEQYRETRILAKATAPKRWRMDCRNPRQNRGSHEEKGFARGVRDQERRLGKNKTITCGRTSTTVSPSLGPCPPR